eukprot:1441115-Rhodomonas_salina.2
MQVARFPCSSSPCRAFRPLPARFKLVINARVNSPHPVYQPCLVAAVHVSHMQRHVQQQPRDESTLSTASVTRKGCRAGDCTGSGNPEGKLALQE